MADIEKWELLDGKGNPTGHSMTRGDRIKPGQYHLVVHIWIVDDTGRVLVQKRAAHLKLMPDIWAVTGGSAILGEESLAAARRELKEELGVDTAPGDLQLMGRLRRRNSFCDLWLLRRNVDVDDLNLQKEEVSDARWMSWGKMMEMVEAKTFHHYGKEYFDYVYAHIYSSGDSN